MLKVSQILKWMARAVSLILLLFVLTEFAHMIFGDTSATAADITAREVALLIAFIAMSIGLAVSLKWATYGGLTIIISWAAFIIINGRMTWFFIVFPVAGLLHLVYVAVNKSQHGSKNRAATLE